MGFLRKHLSIVIAYGICVVASFALPGGTATAFADSLSNREYQIKASFLYNFTKFVEWPADRFADEGTPIIICVIGKDPFGTTLEDTVAGKIVKGRHIGIRRIDNVVDLDAYHVLFVGSAARARL